MVVAVYIIIMENWEMTSKFSICISYWWYIEKYILKRLENKWKCVVAEMIYTRRDLFVRMLHPSRSKQGFHFWVEGIFVACCKKREKKAIKSDRKMLSAYFRRCSVGIWNTIRHFIFAQIVPGVTRCILSLISFPCDRVRVRVILPVSVPGTGVS